MTDVMNDIAAEAVAAAEETPPDKPAATLEAAQALGAEVNTLDERIAKGQKLLKELGERRNAILGRELVDIMDDLGMESFTVDGVKFDVGPYYHASIPEEHRDAAHDWLEQHEAGDLINNQIVASFPKEHQEEAIALETYIRERYQMAEVERKRGVPWARLTSWLRELFENQTEETVIPPLEIMGAKIGRVVKIKPPKKSAT